MRIEKDTTSQVIFIKIIFSQVLACIVFMQCASIKPNSIKNEDLHIAALMCEDHVEPAGVPLEGFYFRWELSSKTRAQYQQAYQLVVSSDAASLDTQKNLVWNSGVVRSSNSVHIAYQGEKLKPGKKYFWRVKVWDKNNSPSAWSNTASFTTGIFHADDWSNAKWISYEELPDSLIVSPGVEDFSSLGNKCLQRPVVPLFRKEFAVSKEVANATVFVSGLGHYEMSINGVKAGDRFLAPGWTNYDKQCLYNMYDITGMLKKGINAIGVIAGNGFYNINRERYIKLAVASGTPKVICKIQITYTDGSSAIVVSDTDWKTSPSAIFFTSIFGGEDYDARQEQPGWNTAGFNDDSWKNALMARVPAGTLKPETDYPVTVSETFEAKLVIQTSPGIYLYDFGQNASGIIELQVKGNKGDNVKLTPAELITTDKQPNQKASGAPYYFTYILKGDGVETWRPKFTYYGFRYVQVQGAVPSTEQIDSQQPQVIKLSMLHTRNSAPSMGTFSCSNELFNKTFHLIDWAIKSNMQSIITDCPHREKLGWLEQDHLMGKSIHYNYAIHQLYAKIVDDMIDAQTEEGLVPDIAPEFVVFSEGFRDSPEWGSSSIILPWQLYTWYGDTGVMKKAYPMMKKYMAYLEKKANQHILSYGLGDWYDYGPQPPGFAQLTPVALTATGIYYYDLTLMAKMAALLHDDAEAKRFSDRAAEVKLAFNTKFFNTQTKIYSTGSQTAMALPLCVGLVEEEFKKEVVANLIRSIKKSGNALTAGDIGFHYLIKALDDAGASHITYDMNARNDVPGYGFQLEKGATTLTESWNARTEVSNNHLMLGHIMEWFYSGLAGIGAMEDAIAFQHIKIRPEPVGDVTSAKGSFHSPYGVITTDWRKDSVSFEITIDIPVNAIATVYLPSRESSQIMESNQPVRDNKAFQWLGYKEGKTVIQIGSGHYTFSVR